MIDTPATHEQTTPTMSKHESHTKAITLLNQLIEKDQRFIDLADLLKGATSQQYTSPLIGSHGKHIITDSICMPDILERAYDNMERYSTFAGILPEIGRAWVAVDNVLYLWDYINGTDVYRYDDQDQIICDVGLCKPKAGDFGNHFQHVLIVSTPLEVILLGVGWMANDTTAHTMELFATDISVPSDDVQMNSIKGTKNGRVFMCGSDGHLYEFEYHHPKSWYRGCRLRCLSSTGVKHYLPRIPYIIDHGSPKYKHIVIDNDRNVLYAFSSGSTIEVFYLGMNQTEFTSVAKNTDIASQARMMCRQNSMVMYAASDFNIEYLHVISPAESSKVHLVAVTERGFRLYFTHQRDALRTQFVHPPNIKMVPDALELVHIRLPPPLPPTASAPASSQPSSSSSPPSPSSFPLIHSSYYDCGVFLAFQHVDDQNDIVHMTAASIGDTLQLPSTYNTPTMTTQRLPFVETASVLDSHGKVWAVSEATTAHKGKYPINDVGSQLTDEPRKFLVFTDRGLSFFNKQRPVDILYQLLWESKVNAETSQHDLLTFFDTYGQTQACAMCLSIICANYAIDSADEVDIGKRARQLFFDFGGQPSASGPSAAVGNYLGQAVGQTGIVYSSKHDGLVLYFARLVADVWKTKVFEISSQTNQADFSSKIQARLFHVKTCLSKFKRFMDENPEFHDISPTLYDRLHPNNHNALQLLLAEQQSIHRVYELLKQCIEAISFIDFIIDSNLKDVLQCVPEEKRKEITEISLETLLSSSEGKTLKCELVIATIYKYGSTHIHAGYDIVSDFLQRKCPTFFGQSDMTFYKGIENLTCAHKADEEYERNLALDESLKYFKEAAENISDDKMAEICTEYRYQGYYVGAVQLALERAKKMDPQEQGLGYMEANKGSSSLSLSPSSAQPLSPSLAQTDDLRVHFYHLRLRCYEHIFQSLGEVRQLQQGIQVTVKGKCVRVHDPDTLANQVLSTALSSDDKLFHYTLYEWYLKGSGNDNSMLTELLSVDTKYIVPFLKEYVNPYEGMNFLWQYYRRREQYYEAALYLEVLALETPDLPVGKRMEYLALAVVNARSRDPRHLEIQEATQLLQRLEHQMDQLRNSLR